MLALRRVLSRGSPIERLSLELPRPFLHALSSESSARLRWKSPSEIFYDESPRHKKFTSRAGKALRASFENEGGLRHLFTKALGFEICNIRMALDKRTLFVQWDCFPDRKDETVAALRENMTKIRSGVGKYLGARVTPRLEFRHDSLSATQSELDSAFAELEEKEDEEQLKTALGTRPTRL